MTVSNLELRPTEWPKREFRGVPREASDERKAWRERLPELPVGEAFEYDIDAGSTKTEDQLRAIGRATQKIKSAAEDVGVSVKFANTSPNTLVANGNTVTIKLRRVENDEAGEASEGEVAWSDTGSGDEPDEA